MNYTYKKRPIVIEAFQMTEARRWDNSDWPNWLHEAWNMENREPGSLCIDEHDPDKARLYIYTLEGRLCVVWGDYIIQGVQGELYPCKPDIFVATYEEVNN